MNRKNSIEWAIGTLAIFSIAIVVIEFIVELSTAWMVTLYAVDLIICLIFALEFVYRLRQSGDKGLFTKSHWFEILAMVPAVVFYAAGSVSVLSGIFRSLRLIRVVRVVVMLARMRRFLRVTEKFIQRSHLVFISAITFATIFLGGFIVLLFESGNPEAAIKNLPDALWWSISTVTTVGYGDIVPVSIAGRIMGMFLMVVGIGVMAALISQVSAVLVESRLKQASKQIGLKDTITLEIQNKIENIDKLSNDELQLLLNMIKTLSSKETP